MIEILKEEMSKPLKTYTHTKQLEEMNKSPKESQKKK